MRPKTLGVIGLGAIGGSVAWQAARAGVPAVIGYSPATKESARAARAGAITDIAQSVTSLARRADLVVIAAPPAATMEILDDLARGASHGLVTDVASIKQPVMRAAARAGLSDRFAGSHPFVGTHERGFAAARHDRFRDAVVYVSPMGDDLTVAREIADFWQSVLDARPVVLDAHDHDELLAWTSHLPQAVASALAVALAQGGPRGVTYGSGARDTTRLAASSVEMWRDILLLNREEVLSALDGVEDSLGTLRAALTSGDGRALAAWLEEGARWRRRFDR